MLKIQEFIKKNPNDWKEKLGAAPYNLKIEEKGDYVLFKYNQIDSDFSYKICCEARGLILKKPDFKVVRKAFNKFFNVGEPHAASIDWSSATATLKLDGSLITFWYDEGWHISTNGTIDSCDAELNCGAYKTFYDLVAAALQKYNFNFDNLNPFLNYTVELVSPFNQVVVHYDEIELYHILTVDMRNLKEIEVDIGLPKPTFYNFNSKSDYEKLVADFDESKEGIVIKDKFNNRVKLKTPLYFQLHRMRNNGVLTVERVVDLIRANEQDEFLSYFPEFKPMFNQVAAQLIEAQSIINQIVTDVTNWKSTHKDLMENSERTARKWFATDFRKKSQAALYFAEYDGRLNDILTRMSTSKFISTFNIEIKEE